MNHRYIVSINLVGWILLSFAGSAQAFYNPSAGKWISRDPIAEDGGLNLHSFAGNNPMNRVDRLGLFAFDMDVKVAIEGTKVEFGPWTFNAGTKSQHVVHVDTDSESIAQERFIGTTIKYDSSGNEIARATASTNGLRAYITCRKIPTVCGPCKECHIEMIGSAADPLFYGAAPPLDYYFFVSVTVCRGSVYFYYNGEHDGYPSYEYSLGGENIHHWSHVTENTSPLSLYSWSNVRFNGERWLMTRQ